MHLSKLRDQAAHTLVCGTVAFGAGALVGPWACVCGFLMQFYREEGQHGWKAVLTGKGGLLDVIVGTVAGPLGAFAGTMLLHRT